MRILQVIFLIMIYTVSSSASHLIYYDKLTGLMWQDNKATKIFVRSWQEAKKYCQNLTLGGYSDWYLPLKDQLFSLYKVESNLKNLALYSYWSSSQDASYNPYAWFVDSNNGQADYDSKYGKFYVRCVRGWSSK